MRKEQVFDIYPYKMSKYWQERYACNRIIDRFLFNPQGQVHRFEYHYYYEDNHLTDGLYSCGHFRIEGSALRLMLQEEFSWREGDAWTYGTEHKTHKNYSEQPKILTLQILNLKKNVLLQEHEDVEDNKYYKKQDSSQIAVFKQYHDWLKGLHRF